MRRELGDLEHELKKSIHGARWLKPDNLHLTLKFLGNCDPAIVEAIDQTLRGVAERRHAFTFSLDGLGVFPSLRRARVLWVGVGEGTTLFEELAEDIEHAVEELGFQPETRPFHAHVTLARLKNPALIAESTLQDRRLALPTQPLTAASITLFRSLLSPHGAQYSVVSENLLKTA